MSLRRPPKPTLRPFVDLLWSMEAAGARPAASAARELVLPTGAVHIVFRLGGLPLRLFRESRDEIGETIGFSLIGGARARPYLRDVAMPGPSVGALLRPGAAALMFGAPAGEFSHWHTRLDDVWGPAVVAEIRERLSAVPTASGRLDLFETLLAARLPRLRGVDPRIAHALARFGAFSSVGDVVRESGYSHRHFTNFFRDAVGLKPKTYLRILRFGRVLDQLSLEPGRAWSDLAAAEGYADQAHLIREFREFASLSPGRYRAKGPPSPRHVPI